MSGPNTLIFAVALAAGVFMSQTNAANADPRCDPFAIGGTTTLFTQGDTQYCVHQFSTNDSFSVQQPLSSDYLIVGGGGGGAGNTGFRNAGGGGGGAGGLVYRQGRLLAVDSYPVTIGVGGTGINANSVAAGNGGDTIFDGLVALGGGGGIATSGGSNTPASDGGSGGGGRQNPAGFGLQPGSAAGGFGNNGARNDNDLAGGGGGGAGSAPPDISGRDGGVGGDGRDYGNIFGTLFGVNGVFAGGGGGGGHKEGALGVGGTGGGGNGSAARDDIPPTAGIANSGGGGGGGSSSHAGANGGSGVVILRYVINTRPTANAGPDATVFAGQDVTLDGTGSTDPDNDITGYTWVQTGGTLVALTGANTVQPSFTPSQPASGGIETLTFQLTVTDAFGLSHTDTVTITLQGVAVLSATKTVLVFSEDGSGCADLVATPPTEPTNPAAIPGACIEYTITVQNTGPVAAEDITLVDALASHLTLQAAVLDGNWGTGTMLTTPDCPGAGCEVNVSTGVIAANETATITIRATIN